MLHPFEEIVLGGRQSPSCLEGDLYESGELLVITDSPHIITPLFSLTAGVIDTCSWWTGRRKHVIGPRACPRILVPLTVD